MLPKMRMPPQLASTITDFSAVSAPVYGKQRVLQATVAKAVIDLCFRY